MFEWFHEFSHTSPWLALSILIALGFAAAEVVFRLILAWNGCTIDQWRAYKEWKK